MRQTASFNVAQRTLREDEEKFWCPVSRFKHPDGGLPLSASDKKALVAFLKTLTDERYRDSANLAVTK
jgi:hypothetical protein